MKLRYIIIMVVILIGIGGFLLMRHKNKVMKSNEDLDVSNIKSFYLNYSNGYMINANIRYELKIENEKYIAKIKPYGVDNEDELTIEVSKDIMDKASEIFKKYEVNKWDGFNKSDHNVMDGDSFSLGIWLKDDKSIHASGYMMWPDNYRNVREEISDLFMEIYNREKGIENE